MTDGTVVKLAMTYLSLPLRRTKKEKETLLLTITNLGGSDEERMCISFGKKVVKAYVVRRDAVNFCRI